MEKCMILLVVPVLILLCVNVSECNIPYQTRNCRNHVANLSDFPGAANDGKTLNTNVFKVAIANLSKVAADGGALLYVPPGKWLTGSFSLISDFTLYLDKDAKLLASQNESDYDLIDPLPSYGIGRDGGDKRFSSLIFGKNLTDVVITGGNGMIDGQGEIWWKKFRGKELINKTRPYLIEIMSSKRVLISNLILVDSPSWNVHPVYCKNVIIENLTISAPVDSPNTDGINPDSCTNTRIRDCSVISGDDCIAVKSGWDEYGTKYKMPTKNLSIKRFNCTSPDSAIIALGSEMSGGIRNVRADGIYSCNSQSGVRVKTAVGRGAYVRDIFVRNMILETMKYVFWMTGNYGSHPDGGYDPNAIPNITNINYRDVVATNVTMVGNLIGIAGHPFTGICMSNVTSNMTWDMTGSAWNKKKPKLPWNCSDIQGETSMVTPKACEQLVESKRPMNCSYPEDVLGIDKVVLRTCNVF